MNMREYCSACSLIPEFHQREECPLMTCLIPDDGCQMLCSIQPAGLIKDAGASSEAGHLSELGLL
jgi:hypothetical protein